jgi:hypothetical protein
MSSALMLRFNRLSFLFVFSVFWAQIVTESIAGEKEYNHLGIKRKTNGDIKK